MEKSSASGFHGEKSSTSRDLGAGSGAPTKGGTGHLTRSKSSGKKSSGGGAAPLETGHQYGVKKAKGAGGAKRLPHDGVGGPL